MLPSGKPTVEKGVLQDHLLVVEFVVIHSRDHRLLHRRHLELGEAVADDRQPLQETEDNYESKQATVIPVLLRRCRTERRDVESVEVVILLHLVLKKNKLSELLEAIH